MNLDLDSSNQPTNQEGNERKSISISNNFLSCGCRSLHQAYDEELITSFEGRVPRRVYWGVSLASAAIFYGISIPLTFINETLGGIAMLLLLIPHLGQLSDQCEALA